MRHDEHVLRGGFGFSFAETRVARFQAALIYIGKAVGDDVLDAAMQAADELAFLFGGGVDAVQRVHQLVVAVFAAAVVGEPVFRAVVAQFLRDGLVDVVRGLSFKRAEVVFAQVV